MVGTIPARGVVIALARISDRRYYLIAYGHRRQHLRTSGVKRFSNGENSPEHLVVMRSGVEIGVADHGGIREGGHLVRGFNPIAHNRARTGHRLRKACVDSSRLAFEAAIEAAQGVV